MKPLAAGASAGAVLGLAGLGLDLVATLALVAGTPIAPVLEAVLPGGASPGASWFALHGLAAALAGTGVALLAAARSRTAPERWLAPCLAACAAMPVVGAPGLAGALLAGIGAANASRERAPRWTTIEPVALPFAAPARRAVPRHDVRGLGEQLRHSTDVDALYRRVLAAASMPDALSVGALQAAIAHPDDRVRLTAYQTLDAKVSRLNLEIQRLEAGIERLEELADDPAAARELSNAWLQVTANCRELLTLEEAEPVARRQLLDKAADAATRAARARPTSAGAHYALGQVALQRGDLAAADAFLARALKLGMSIDTVAPRLAESAFAARDYPRVRALLGRIGPAHLAYPPLRDVAEQWR